MSGARDNFWRQMSNPAHQTSVNQQRSADQQTRRRILRQAVSISLAVTPFGVAFGVVCSEAGLSLLEAMGFSTLVFTGSAQFAAVSVLAEGGTVPAAVVAGLLLNLRCLAFGVVMAPSLQGSFPWRMAVSQLMIDESTAVGSVQTGHRWRRYGFLAGGLGVFFTWNLSTALGVVLLGDASDLIQTAGIDATIPAAFLALLWPRLADRRQRAIAVLGAAIALLVAPVVPPGLPILAAALAVVVVKPWRRGSGRHSEADALGGPE